MNCRLFVFLYLIVAAHTGLAQEDAHWIFGSTFGGGTNLAGLDFNQDPPRPYIFNTQFNIATFGEGSASISDKNGNLLFASDGYNVWDRNGIMMRNARRGINFPETITLSGSASQGVLIIKGQNRYQQRYYVVSIGSNELGPLLYGRCSYSVVDMSLDNGWGDIDVNERNITLSEPIFTEHMTLVPGDCNSFIWILLINRFNSNLYAYKVTMDGISRNPVISNLGRDWVNERANTNYHLGWMVSNNAYNKLAVALYNSHALYAMDFDNNTGIASNIAIVDSSKNQAYYGVAYSPNDSFLYSNEGERLLNQYEVYNNYNKKNVNQNVRSFAGIRLGPDGRMYLGTISTRVDVPRPMVQYIENPNERAENLRLGYFTFPSDNVGFHLGLPNINGIYPEFSVPGIDALTTVSSYKEIELWLCKPGFDSLRLTSKDTFNEKYIFINEKEAQLDLTNSIWVADEGIYVIETISKHSCNRNVDTFDIRTGSFKAKFGGTTDPSCNDDKNGKVKLIMNDVDTNDLQLTWLDRNYQDTLAQNVFSLDNLPAGQYALLIRYKACDTLISYVIGSVYSELQVDYDTLLCQGSLLNVFIKNINDYDSTSLIIGNTHYGNNFRNLDTVIWQPGNHNFTIYGYGKCLDEFKGNVEIDSQYEASFYAVPDSICTGDKFTFYPQAHHTATELSWYLGKHQFSINQPNEISHSFDEAGEIPVTLFTNFRICPTVRFSDYVYVYKNPEVDLGSDSFLCYQGKAIMLENIWKYPSTSSSYQWSTGDTTEKLKVTSPGLYSLKQTSQPLGCTGYGMIEIDKDCFVDIPNAFTPNGDGINDYFFPRAWLSRGIVTFQFRIYNRWGQLIFETNQKEGLGWDGRFNGQEQPVGVYVFLAEVTFRNGASEKYEGNVSLLR